MLLFLIEIGLVEGVKMLNKGYIKTTPYGLGFSELFFEDNLKKYFSDPALEVLSAEYSPSASDKMAWSVKHPKQGDHPIGVQRYKISFKKNGKIHTRHVIAKSKISDKQYLQIISNAFAKCGIQTEIPIPDYLSQLEFSNLNRKEITIYHMQDSFEAFRYAMPLCYGSYLDEQEEICVLILECLDEKWLSLDPFNTSKWDQTAIEALIDAIASMHAVWYKKENAIAEIKGFKNPLNTDQMQRLMPYWNALAKAVKTSNLPFLTKEDYLFHTNLIETMPQWHIKIDAMAKTLVQNDCVPKNIALCNQNGVKKVLVYDWEIATIHIPQRDIVEFLSYVLPENFDSKVLGNYIERHRIKLGETTKQAIDATEWRLGFQYALYDYLIQRVFPQIPFEKLEARNIAKVYNNARRMMALLD